MAKIAKALTISEIEQILCVNNPCYETRPWNAVWNAEGVECRRDRHRYSGPAYEFTMEILQLRFAQPGRPSWQMLIGTERWPASPSKALTRDTKWVKLVTGKSSDVRDWLRRCRPMNTA